jgi:hypothetical protein
MSDFNEPNEVKHTPSEQIAPDIKEEQHEFNKKFLVNLMIFMFFYRFYIMHIDPNGTLINLIEKFLKSKTNTDTNFEQIIDDLD